MPGAQYGTTRPLKTLLQQNAKAALREKTQSTNVLFMNFTKTTAMHNDNCQDN